MHVYTAGSRSHCLLCILLFIVLSAISMIDTGIDTTSAVSEKNSDNMEKVEEEKQSWQTFTQETSMHGIRYIHLPASSTIRR